MESRQDRERAFHNAAFSDHRRSAVVPAYALMHDSRVAYEQVVREKSRAARVLEYGCGSTAMASSIAHHAEEMVGIDISDVAVRDAADRAALANAQARYQVMDAEALEFEDGSFDLVCSVAVLH